MRSPIVPGSRMPPITPVTSSVWSARRRIGSTTWGTKSSLAAAGRKLSWPHLRPSSPAVIEPPETLEIRLTVPSTLASWSRQSVPIWNSIAR